MEQLRKPISRLNLDEIEYDFFTQHLQKHRSDSKSLQSFVSSGSCVNNITVLPIENAVIQYVLQKAIDRLIIINRGFAATTAIELLFEPKIKLCDKFKKGVVHTEQLYDDKTLECLKEGLMKMIYYKFAKDVDDIKTTLEATITELHAHSTFQKISSLAKEFDVKMEDHDIIYLYVKQLNYYKYLEEKAKTYSEKYRDLKIKQKAEMQQLSEAVDDCRLWSAIESRYTNNWENCRLSQKTVLVKMEEDGLTNTYNKTLKKIANETEISYEIQEYMEFKINNSTNLIEYWMNKCETELEQMDDEIQVLTENIKVLEIRAEYLNINYTSRQKEIDDFWELKRQRIEEIKLMQKKVLMAIQIQAWWRGTMVRKHLGPYKIRKNKKKHPAKKTK